MKYEDVEKAIMDFFGDTSRSAGDTMRGLLALAEKCEELADTIRDDEEEE